MIMQQPMITLEGVYNHNVGIQAQHKMAFAGFDQPVGRRAAMLTVSCRWPPNNSISLPKTCVRGNPFGEKNDFAAIDRARLHLSKFSGIEQIYQFMIFDASRRAKSINFNEQYPGSAEVVINSVEVFRVRLPERAGRSCRATWPRQINFSVANAGSWEITPRQSQAKAGRWKKSCATGGCSGLHRQMARFHENNTKVVRFVGCAGRRQKAKYAFRRANSPDGAFLGSSPLKTRP